MKEWHIQRNQDRTLISLSAAGMDVSDAVYHSIWAAKDVASARQWRTRGTTDGFKNNAAATTFVATIMKGFMQSTGIRQAQVTIVESLFWNEPTAGVSQRSIQLPLKTLSCSPALARCSVRLQCSHPLMLENFHWTPGHGA